MKNKLRLLLFNHCNRKCRGCCNKDFELDTLPVCTDFSNYRTVMLTGGEPLLKPAIVLNTIKKIRKENKDAKIYVYTAMSTEPQPFFRILNECDGITLTLHTKKDVKSYNKLMSLIEPTGNKEKWNTSAMRLNVFHNVPLDGLKSLDFWNLKSDIHWIKNCPLPDGEVFMRL